MTRRQNPTRREVETILRAGLDDLAADLPKGAPVRLDRLTLRLPQGAGPVDVSTALRRALTRPGETGGKDSA